MFTVNTGNVNFTIDAIVCFASSCASVWALQLAAILKEMQFKKLKTYSSFRFLLGIMVTLLLLFCFMMLVSGNAEWIDRSLPKNNSFMAIGYYNHTIYLLYGSVHTFILRDRYRVTDIAVCRFDDNQRWRSTR